MVKAFKPPSLELSTVLKNHRHHLFSLTSNTWQARTLFALSRCRTKEMGGHIDKCSDTACSSLHISYNSCRNRHCPKCQGHLKEKWMCDREKELLNTAYFHVVFTIPHELNTMVLHDPKVVYRVLFKSAWQILVGFGNNPKLLGAQVGMIALLHTWGQNLSLHPHLHCIVPAGGLTKGGKWVQSKSKGKFLFPVKKMSNVFRAKFVENLRKETGGINNALSDKLFAKKWVIYTKKPFFGAKQVIEYLGRYSHKIAISNHRIKGIEGHHAVTFEAKSYKKGGKKELLTLSQAEFIRRFSLHILPKGFTKIRHYGILSSSSKKKVKGIIDQQLGKVIIVHSEEKKPLHRVCPTCGKGHLVTLTTFEQRGPPMNWKALFS